MGEGGGIHGKEFRPQWHIQGGHPGTVPEGPSLKAPALEEIGVVAYCHGQDMHDLAGIGDDGVMLLGGGLHYIPAAHPGCHALQGGQVLWGALLPGSKNEVGPPEEAGVGVENA